MRNLFWWAIGGFAVYEVIAWKVNDSRIAASLKVPGGGSYSPMPLDLIGRYMGYPNAGLGPAVPAIPSQPLPAGVTRGLADPAAARAAAFNAANYPGVAAMPAGPAFDPSDPLGLTRPLWL